MGYTRVRAYEGGMADWTAAGMRVERSARVPDWAGLFLDALSRRSTRELLGVWGGMIVAFGLVYGFAGLVPSHGLFTAAGPVPATPSGFLTALYFSFVTALSVGYGDVVPLGLVRVFAVVEGAAGLLIFGCVISKLVSTRQEELTESIHRIAFEDRLGRIRTHLHLVLSELQSIPRECDEAREGERVLARIESAAAVFAGELTTIHQLLYRPDESPDEAVLEGILASLEASLREFADLRRCAVAAHRDSPSLRRSLGSIGRLAGEICGECVPREYAPDLKSWMDRVQALAREIEQGEHARHAPREGA